MLKMSVHRTADAVAIQKANVAVQNLKNLTSSGFMQTVFMDEMWSSATAHGHKLAQSFSTLGLIGIGGSSLGPKVIQQFLSAETQNQIVFFENVDPISFSLNLKRIGNFGDAHWLVISKSGKTLETLAQLTLLLTHYKESDYAKHFTVVSDPGNNPLTDWARSHQVPIFHIPKNVGGRYSVLTPVGIIPTAFLGVSTDELRSGAQEALAQTETLAKVVAQVLTSFKKNEWITVFWSYSDLLSHFGGWVQQLWAESLAKRLTREASLAPQVSTPLALVGANDQHSILQQVMDGARDKFIFFIGIESVEQAGDVITNVIGLPDFINGKTLGAILKAERLATQQALKAEGIHSLELVIVDLSPKSLGFLFQFFEMLVAGVAESLDIDAFDQPGVELGKRLAMQILSQ